MAEDQTTQHIVELGRITVINSRRTATITGIEKMNRRMERQRLMGMVATSLAVAVAVTLLRLLT